MKENNQLNWSKDILPSLGGQTRAILQKEEARKRIDEYNQNPNLCLNCGGPILAPYNKTLRETKVKKFCNKSCAAQYNNKNRKYSRARINLMPDEELIDAFLQSSSISEFAEKIGYNRETLKEDYVIKRLNALEINLNDLKQRTRDRMFSTYTKGEAFALRKSWQSVRSSIARLAREEYQKSDRPKHCIVCGYPHYEVAHIKAVSDFSDDTLISDINSIDNLIGLCPNHHYEYDNGILLKEELLNAIENNYYHSMGY